MNNAWSLDDDYHPRSPEQPIEVVKKKKKKKQESQSRRRRRRLFKTRDPICHYCKVELTLKDSTVDHKIPRSRGGGNEDENLVLCCHTCNQDKDDRTVPEYSLVTFYRKVKKGEK